MDWSEQAVDESHDLNLKVLEKSYLRGHHILEQSQIQNKSNKKNKNKNKI